MMRVAPEYLPEAMLTASVLHQPTQYEVVRWVGADLFSNEHNRQVWVAISWVLEHKTGIDDPAQLLSEVRAMLVEYNKGEALKRLLTLTDQFPALGALAEVYAKALWEQQQHADLASASIKMTQIVNSDIPLDEKCTMIEQTWMDALEAAHTDPGWKPIAGLQTVADFLDRTDADHEWVIPGMLERQERFMLVAPEKAGKSVLTRQVALLLAAGRHPFNHKIEVPPMRTLLVDLENPEPVARRDFRRQVSQMDGLWTTDNSKAFLWHKPAGMHLGDAGERTMLRLAVERYDIDLLCISPVYKAYDGLDRSWEEQAHGVQKPLDKLREDFGCAIWLEHHSPWKGSADRTREFRPLGSSRWSRWLDYQAALTGEGAPPYQVLQWTAVRRDERKLCPVALRRGFAGGPSWLPVWPDGPDDGWDIAMHEALY